MSVFCQHGSFMASSIPTSIKKELQNWSQWENKELTINTNQQLYTYSTVSGSGYSIIAVYCHGSNTVHFLFLLTKMEHHKHTHKYWLIKSPRSSTVKVICLFQSILSAYGLLGVSGQCAHCLHYLASSIGLGNTTDLNIVATRTKL